LIAESDLNDPRVIRPKEVGGLGMDAQWSDDFHHALHAVVTGNKRGYFADFGSVADIGKAITASFVYDGQHAPHRRRRHGAPAAADAGDRFVSFIQNHDQIANAYQGRRIGEVAGLARQKVAAMVLFSTPALPLLFQGEEWAEDAPFDYFTSHGDAALAEAVRKGRHEEYLHLLEEGADMGSWADPQAEETFRRCKLKWDFSARAPHAEMLAFYRELIALRRRLAPLRNGRKDLTQVEWNEAARWLTIRRGDDGGGATFTCANLGDAPARLQLPDGKWTLALATDAMPEPASDNAVAIAPSAAAIYERAG
jgi:maltooligosyltrehalose trehalohydrolase